MAALDPLAFLRAQEAASCFMSIPLLSIRSVGGQCHVAAKGEHKY
jgi:hypothetical protein